MLNALIIGVGAQSLVCHSQTTMSDRVGDLGFGDLGRDYKGGFQRGVIPKGEVGHVRRHVIRRITSEDYTSQT